MTSPAGPNPLQRFLRVQRAHDRELDSLLRAAARDADRRVRALAGRQGIGAQVRAAQLTQIRAELLRTSRILWPNVNVVLTRQLEAAVQAAADAASAVDRVIFRAAGGMPTGLADAHRAQARDTLRFYEARTANGIPLSEQVYRTQQLADGFVDRQVNLAILQGSSWKEIADRVRGSILPNVRGGVAYAAKRLGRTELNNAFHTAQKAAHLDEPWVETYRWRLSGSHPKIDACDDLAGTVHFDGGEPGHFRKEDLPSKPHPQCLCHFTAETVSIEAFVTNFRNGRYDRYLDEKIGDYASLA